MFCCRAHAQMDVYLRERTFACAREKFGGDSLGDFLGAYRVYRERIDWQPRTR